MATEPATETKTATKLKLDPPDALQPVAPAQASGLVPLKAEETTELDKRVAQFVDEAGFKPGAGGSVGTTPAVSQVGPEPAGGRAST